MESIVYERRFDSIRITACPELPQRLHIDGREVSPLQHLMLRSLTMWQLFGRMMRTAQKVNEYVYEAILRIKGSRALLTLLFFNSSAFS